MQTYELRLESPYDSQHRKLILDASSEQDARDQAHAKELAIVNFSLLPPERDVWESPPGTRDDDPDGLVDLARWDAYDPLFAAHAATQPYDDAVRLAKLRLEDFTDRAAISTAGKARGVKLGMRTKGRVLAHYQTEPFQVAAVQEITAQQQAAYASVDGMRELVALARKLKAENDPKWDPRGWERIFEQFEEWGVPLNIVTAAIHGVGVLAQDTGGTPIVWGTGTGGDDIYVTLYTGYTADPDTHDFRNDASTEITGTGYTTPGLELAGKAVSYDTGTDQTRLDATDPAWTTSTLSTTDAVVNKNTGTASTSPIYASIDFGATVTTTAGTLTIAFDATGVIVRDYT